VSAASKITLSGCTDTFASAAFEPELDINKYTKVDSPASVPEPLMVNSNALVTTAFDPEEHIPAASVADTIASELEYYVNTSTSGSVDQGIKESSLCAGLCFNPDQRLEESAEGILPAAEEAHHDNGNESSSILRDKTSHLLVSHAYETTLVGDCVSFYIDLVDLQAEVIHLFFELLILLHGLFWLLL
jgi:hypothetical protein